jgi:Lar family restriction alleviation protein
MAEKKLKRCPFCGGRAEISRVYDVNGKYKNCYTVFCTNICDCGASVDGHEYSWEAAAKDSAINTWNRRADNEA